MVGPTEEARARSARCAVCGSDEPEALHLVLGHVPPGERAGDVPRFSPPFNADEEWTEDDERIARYGR